MGTLIELSLKATIKFHFKVYTNLAFSEVSFLDYCVECYPELTDCIENIFPGFKKSMEETFGSCSFPCHPIFEHAKIPTNKIMMGLTDLKGDLNLFMKRLRGEPLNLEWFEYPYILNSFNQEDAIVWAQGTTSFPLHKQITGRAKRLPPINYNPPKRKNHKCNCGTNKKYKNCCYRYKSDGIH